MIGGYVWPLLAFGEQAEGVMHLSHIGIEATGSLQQLVGAREVAPLALDETQVDERLHEAGAVFQRETEPRVRGFQVPLGQRLRTAAIQFDGLGRQGSDTGAAADEEQES